MLLNDLLDRRSREMKKQGLRGVTLLNSFNAWSGFWPHLILGASSILLAIFGGKHPVSMLKLSDFLCPRHKQQISLTSLLFSPQGLL